MYVPERMCIACRTRRPAHELLRIAADKEANAAVPDAYGKLQGRGAYICRDIKCIRQAEKKRIPEKHLKLAVCDGFYRQLEDMI